MSDTAEDAVVPTTTIESNDRVITSPSGALIVTIPARSNGRWKFTYCGHDCSDDCIIAGEFPELEFRLPRADGGFDVFPFNASKREFGEPYSIKPGLGRRFQEIVTGRRLLLAAALLATLVAGIGGVIVCNTGGDDSDGSDAIPPVAGEAEPDRIG